MYNMAKKHTHTNIQTNANVSIYVLSYVTKTLRNNDFNTSFEIINLSSFLVFLFIF